MFTREEYRQWMQFHCSLFPGFEARLPPETIEAWYDVFIQPSAAAFDGDDFVRWSKSVALSGREIHFWEVGRKSFAEVKAEKRRQEITAAMKGRVVEDATRYTCPLCMDRGHVVATDDTGVVYAVRCGASPGCREQAEALRRDSRHKDRLVWWSPDHPTLRLKDGRRMTLLHHTVLAGHYPGEQPPRRRPGTAVDFSTYEHETD